MIEKQCERCDAAPRLKKQRYCKDCKAAVLKELQDVGYLKPVPFLANSRSMDARENTRETARGIDR
jgi:hypothetical protein